MGKQKWNKDKPKRSGVFRVRHTFKGYQDTTDTVAEGYAWFDATLRRWAGTRPSVQGAREAADTAAPRYLAGQEKEWCRV